MIIQTASFIVFSARFGQVYSSQSGLRQDLIEVVDDFKQDTQYKIDEIVRVVGAQRTDFEQKIETLQNTQQGFSAVTQSTIRSVVSVGTERSSGTGFVVDDEGYVVTNHHVIDSAQNIRVLTYEGATVDAVLVGSDAELDVALLKVNKTFLKLPLAKEIQIGEQVIAIGNPLGLSFSVTQGIVSATQRSGPNGLPYYVQTDVTLNPGNSGGPLINTHGEVVGMNNFKIGGAEGLGFALESAALREMINLLANQTLIE